MELNEAYLILSDGTLLRGKSFGSRGTEFGEIVFNTGMTGYQEVLTDPSYYGQLITFTYPEFGNTGINAFDLESIGPSVKGVVCRQFTSIPSNWRASGNIENWLKKYNIVGISGIDTRALVRHLREHGSMNAVISNDKSHSIEELLKKLKKLPSMEGLNLAKEVSTKKSYLWSSSTTDNVENRSSRMNQESFNVLAIDFGIKKSILDRLNAYGCTVEVVPYSTPFSEILKRNPEGIFFSNGPGDPASVIEGIDLAKDLINKTNIPIFGICLGHQILGLALGGSTFKLKYGHRGLNHPCGKIGQLEITSQNHGFALLESSLDKEVIEITHFNLNDKTVAGISMKKRAVFGIQYHPEASPGPHDADHHFARFVALMLELR